MGCRKHLFSESGHSRERDGGTRTPQRQQLDVQNHGTERRSSTLNESSPKESLMSAIDDPQSVGGQSPITGVFPCSEELDVASDGYRTLTRTACEKGIGRQRVSTPATMGAVNTSSGAVSAGASSSRMFSPMATVTAAQAQVSPMEGELHTHKEPMDHELVPKVGMSFNGEGEAKEFYRRYADAEKDLKEKFDSVLNHPLTPVEFEAAWQELLDEFELHTDSTLDSLYRQRELYIPVYFKDQYCGRMASTQRSESANFVMKKCFVNNKTALHRFAKKTLDFVHTRKMKEAEKTYHGTSRTITRGKWRFELQASKIYTRGVFKDFEKKMVDCTAYNVEEDQNEGEKCYLITHTNRSSKITWGQHQFKVLANKEEGNYRCECREFEHTGLLCVHLLRAFIHIQLEKIPEQYFLKRYTKYARQEKGFSMDDKLPTGKEGVTLKCRTKRLQSKAMAAVRSGVMSEAAVQNTEKGLDRIIRENKNFPPDIGQRANNGQRQATTRGLSSCSEGEDLNDDDQQSEMDATETEHVAGGSSVLDMMEPSNTHGRTVIDDSMISRVPPPLAKPKGRKLTEKEKKEITLGAKGEKKGTKRCGVCGLFATHNARTCLQLKHNRERLEAMQNRERGQSLRAKKRSSAMQHEGEQQEQDTIPATRRKVLPQNRYAEWDSDNESADDMDVEG